MLCALAAPAASWSVAHLFIGGGLFVWFCVALVLMFAAKPQWGMPLVGAVGMVGAILLALFLAWLTTETTR